jgi:hypothetical protein
MRRGAQIAVQPLQYAGVAVEVHRHPVRLGVVDCRQNALAGIHIF